MQAALAAAAGQAAAAAVQAAGVRRDKSKLVHLTEPTAEAWRAWRLHFENVATFNRWNAATAKAAIGTTITGNAISLIRGLDYGRDDAAVTLAQALDRVAARFVTPADTDRAAAEYETARMQPGESITSYHSRLETLHATAFPNMANPQNDRTLITKFLTTMADGAVKTALFGVDAATYQAALAAANRVEARIITDRQKNAAGAGLHAIGGGDGSPAKQARPANQNAPTGADVGGFVAAIRQLFNSPARPQGCHACDSADHFIRDCPYKDFYNKGIKQGENRARKRKRGDDQGRPAQGGRGRAPSRGGQGGQGGRGGGKPPGGKGGKRDRDQRGGRVFNVGTGNEGEATEYEDGAEADEDLYGTGN